MTSQCDDQGAGHGGEVPAIEELTARGVNVNVTLLFSVERYEQVMEAYLRGLERRAESGETLSGLASVASFFVSRVDSKADALLAPDSPLRGRIAIANAHRAYGRYLERFAGDRWEALRSQDACPQRPLWASTGTKDPAYSDVLYVERLIAPGVVNTMPEKTLRLFAEHGKVGHALDANLDEVERLWRRLGRPASICQGSPQSSSARAWRRSVPPTTSCSTASGPSWTRWRGWNGHPVGTPDPPVALTAG